MQKKGQVMLFVILGIIVVGAIVFGFAMRKTLFKGAAESFTKAISSFNERVDAVDSMITKCLENTLTDGIVYASTKKSKEPEKDIERYIQANMMQCIDFSQFNDLNIDADNSVSSVEVNFGADDSIATAQIKYNLKITKEDKEASLSEFLAKEELKSRCCFDIEVDENCIAQETKEVSSCQLSTKIMRGTAVTVGGECIAC